MAKFKKYLRVDEGHIASVYNKRGEGFHLSRKKGKGRLFNEFLDMPTTFWLLPKRLKGVRVLDAGCGSGLYCIRLAKMGAKVSGIDISEKMIEIAGKETPKDLKVSYVIGSIYKMPFRRNTFDLIICNYVLENVEDITIVFKEFYRVLKEGGECIFSISHPLRALAQKVEKNGKEVWVIENYYDKSIRESDLGDGLVVKKYKRNLEDYSRAIREAGFLISEIIEPRPIKEGAETDPSNYKKAMRLPQLLTMKLKKH